MPKRSDINSIMIIGAGPIVIGQACEFDYSGAQACKALREEGYKVVLVNSNPATIMTDPEMADKTYIEPITPYVIKKIIEKEKPCALLPTMGGQTALNCTLDLQKENVLQNNNVELIGASITAIEKAEDREKFKKSMRKIGLNTPESVTVNNLENALEVQKKIGYPTIIRPSFTLGGAGGGIAYNHQEFINLAQHGLDISPSNEILIEKSVIGWKEFEMEVVRDKNDNCIIICSIENIDPMGVHTGDSITVAPAQTLTDKEFQIMRNASINVLREIGVETGGSNVQFAVNPLSGEMLVIEMNPRVSRSSALASKATGFPIAKIAAKLAVGFTLDELQNEITSGMTPASFEPTIDYVVTKVPRFTFEKFPGTDETLTTQMKSVGEVMAIGRTFQESIQKALRGLEVGVCGFDKKSDDLDIVKKEIATPTCNRIFYIADAFRLGLDVKTVYELTNIDRWFLHQVEDIIKTEKDISSLQLNNVDEKMLKKLKGKGFSDFRIAKLLKTSEEAVRNRRWEKSIRPVYKRVDTCGGEFSTNTAYLYSTYDEECESMPSKKKKVIILGGGPNRIGQGIEFDYCCVHASFSLKEDGYETIMINCNPETVSTDFDSSDRLYFEPLTLEDVIEIVLKEKPIGVLVQFGGQTPLNLASKLDELNVPIMGTSPKMIDNAEDRDLFKKTLEKLGLNQPENRIVSNSVDVLQTANEIGYPIVVRPSYVLGGRAMEIIHSEIDLNNYIELNNKNFKNNSILLDKFLDDAIEVDVDAVSDLDDVVIGGIMEHIEEAGVHSGDSACSLPPFSLSEKVMSGIRKATKLLAIELKVIGLMNIQFAVKDEKIYVLEVNPRASRTIPFVSKSISKPLAKIAAKCMTGISLKDQDFQREIKTSFFSVKEAVFPFIKFKGVDAILGPEMKSTGEVMGIAETFEEAFLKSQIATGISVPEKGNILISVKDQDKKRVLKVARKFVQAGFKIFATKGTSAFLIDNGIKVFEVNKVRDGRPHIVDKIKNGEIQLIINTVDGNKNSISDSYSIRRSAVQDRIAYYTTIPSAWAISSGIEKKDDLEFTCLQELKL